MDGLFISHQSAWPEMQGRRWGELTGGPRLRGQDFIFL